MRNEQPRRAKSEKFGILDSPALLKKDLARVQGIDGIACLYLDIDNFKAMNTRFSERVVDTYLLRPYQRMLAGLVTELGYVYAEGGDETIILLPNASMEKAVGFAECLRISVHSHVFRVMDDDVRLSISVGVAHGPCDGDREALPNLANLAMRKAKKMGKDCIYVHFPEGAKRAVFELRFE